MNIVVTTIFPPTEAMRMLSEGLSQVGGTLWVVGDRKGPVSFDLPHVQFLHIDAQKALGFSLAQALPERHYARKNLGYLAAMRAGAECIVETDDDNFPRQAFFHPRVRSVTGRSVASGGRWCNVYKAFTDQRVWPRGLPLEAVRASEPEVVSSRVESDCLIQQGLADDNPDVDAVYRLVSELPLQFRADDPVILRRRTWCPFNSQNTTFFREAFPLLYLPSYCSFRMTDIWRSFVAQRCLWEMGSQVAFHAATVWQERNEHNLLRDFSDEVPGYLNNERIRGILDSLELHQGTDAPVVCGNLVKCYQALSSAQLVGDGEVGLVQAWVDDALGTDS